MKDKLKGLLFNSKIRGYTNKNLAKYTLYDIPPLRTITFLYHNFFNVR